MVLRGGERMQTNMQIQSIDVIRNIDQISFENKGNIARVEFLHTIHSRHIATI